MRVVGFSGHAAFVPAPGTTAILAGNFDALRQEGTPESQHYFFLSHAPQPTPKGRWPGVSRLSDFASRPLHATPPRWLPEA